MYIVILVKCTRATLLVFVTYIPPPSRQRQNNIDLWQVYAPARLSTPNQPPTVFATETAGPQTYKYLRPMMSQPPQHSAADCEVSVTGSFKFFIATMSAITGILGAWGISIGTNLSSKGEFHSWTLPLAKSTNVTQPITYIPADM